MVRRARYLTLLVLALGVGASQSTDAQSFSRGQSVVPVFEGWEENPDGTFDLMFGYMNRNWDEEVDVPIGPENLFEPGGDHGQPTHFLPRRNLFTFRVRVPKDFGKKELVWTITSRGKTERAYGSLNPGYIIDNRTISGNHGAGGGGTELDGETGNKPPEVAISGASPRTAKVGQPVTLTAIATDDGKPKRRAQVTVEETRDQNRTDGVRTSSTGMRLAWFVYRGSGRVTFDPPQFKTYVDTRSNSPWTPGWAPPPVPADGTWVVRATFSEPGTYVLRCLAHDGGLPTHQDLTMTVTK